MPVAPGTQVQGDTASGAAEVAPVNPVKVGGVGNSTLPSAVTAGQRVAASYTLKGQAWAAVVVATQVADGTGNVGGFNASNDSGQIGQVAPSVFNGANWDRQRGAAKFITLNAVAIGSEATLWTPAAGKKFRLMGGCVSVGTAAGNVSLKDNTGGTLIFILPKTPLDTAFSFGLQGNGILSAAANNVLTGTGAATATISGTIWGTEE